ncbi:MAG: hypothetical protein H6625_14005 [Bdellovibrionaceae bacterium]|nr:hypothetical protein [Pseudobdellovibrionaceae bacterium]
MFKGIICILLSSTFLLACAGKKKKYDPAMLEKYPQCYHNNMKIYNKCVKDNESGKKTSALDIENSGLPTY